MPSIELLLQIWGGVFYLANKIFLAVPEKVESPAKRKLKISGWLVYILGVPAWVIVLVGHNDWIAASIQAGSVPAMLLGLYNVYYKHQKPNKQFNYAVTACTYISLAIGLTFSIAHYGGITTLSQVLEMGVMTGILVGSFLLAKNNYYGWLFFMLMNLSMAALMLLQDKMILMLQQLLSFCFVAYGFYQARLGFLARLRESV